MAVHVTLDGLVEDMKPSIAEFRERLERLQPTSITVDTGGAGRVLLAALQTRGLPATALEKRARPTLAEITRAEELSREVEALKEDARERETELRHLRDYPRDIRVLIARLDG